MQAPDQPVNTDPAAGVALSVTAVSNWALQLPLGAPAAIEQVIPAGVLPTVPAPVPAAATVTVADAAGRPAG